MTYIEELRGVIRHLHKAEATQIESVPVKEAFQGKTVWEGVVEVFELHGHPKATRTHLSSIQRERKRSTGPIRRKPLKWHTTGTPVRTAATTVARFELSPLAR